MSPKGPPLSFLLFCYRMRVYKSKRVPLLHFSALCDIFRKKIFFRKLQVFFQKNVLRFLSLRYSADLRRSRLVLISNWLLFDCMCKLHPHFLTNRIDFSSLLPRSQKSGLCTSGDISIFERHTFPLTQIFSPFPTSD